MCSGRTQNDMLMKSALAYNKANQTVLIYNELIPDSGAMTGKTLAWEFFNLHNFEETEVIRDMGKRQVALAKKSISEPLDFKTFRGTCPQKSNPQQLRNCYNGRDTLILHPWERLFWSWGWTLFSIFAIWGWKRSLDVLKWTWCWVDDLVYFV